VAAYYVVSEALTNAAKHSRASVVHVGVEAAGGALRVAVRDDGVGGADPVRGSGLLGLKDRAEAIGGTISVDSHEGGGTSLSVELPLDARDSDDEGERLRDSARDHSPLRPPLWRNHAPLRASRNTTTGRPGSTSRSK
jgi:signal transduction histidine kinase